MIVGKHHRMGGGVRGTNQICETLASCLVVKNSCQGGEGEQAQTLLAWGQRQQEAVMRKTEGKAASNEAGRVEKVCTRRVTPTHWSRMLDGGGVHCRWVKCTDWQQRMQGESMDRGAKGKKKPRNSGTSRQVLNSWATESRGERGRRLTQGQRCFKDCTPRGR